MSMRTDKNHWGWGVILVLLIAALVVPIVWREKMPWVEEVVSVPLEVDYTTTRDGDNLIVSIPRDELEIHGWVSDDGNVGVLWPSDIDVDNDAMEAVLDHTFNQGMANQPAESEEYIYLGEATVTSVRSDGVLVRFSPKGVSRPVKADHDASVGDTVCVGSRIHVGMKVFPLESCTGLEYRKHFTPRGQDGP